MTIDEIRKKAESLLGDDYPIENNLVDSDLPRIVEELKVHQIELELQNDELRRIQQQLEAAQRKYLDLYNFAPVGYMSFDPNGIVIELNYTAANLLRVPRVRLLGRTLVPYLSSESISNFYQHCHAVLDQAIASPKLVCELVLKEAEGRPRFVQLESIAVTNPADNSIQIRSALVDVTERKLAEKQLRLSESKWAALVNNTSDLIWALDQNYKLIRANTALRTKVLKETGFPLDSGVDVSVINPAEQSEMWRSYYRRAFRGEHFRVELLLGSSLCEVAFNPILSEGSDVTGVVVFARDISERKAIEGRLRRRNKELDTFAHSIAHNLQTPLGLITGYADYLQKHADEVDAAEQRTIAQKLNETASDLSRTIDELLFLAEARTETIQLEPMDMLAITNRVVTQLAAVMAKVGGKISVPAELPPALGYERWVEKVWLNYLNYGLQFGSQPAQLTIGGDAQPDGSVRFWVRDAGPQLFTTAQTDWSGEGDPSMQPSQLILQLAVVTRVVEKMGGQVGVEKRSNRGSELYFTLPSS